jgi:hypothetical protein
VLLVPTSRSTAAKGVEMRKPARLSLTALVATAAVAASAMSAFAQSPANSPEPVAGQPSCQGLIIASFNHNSIGPSGNPTASAGPGPFFGPDTHEAIETLARPHCTPLAGAGCTGNDACCNDLQPRLGHFGA